MYISRLTVGLSRLLDRRVDLIEDDCLLPFARSSADKDKILIYERKNKIRPSQLWDTIENDIPELQLKIRALYESMA